MASGGEQGHVVIRVDVDGKEVEVKLKEIEDGIGKVADAGEDAAGITEDAADNSKRALKEVNAAMEDAKKATAGYATGVDAAFEKTQDSMEQSATEAAKMKSEVKDLADETVSAAEDVSEATKEAAAETTEAVSAAGEKAGEELDDVDSKVKGVEDAGESAAQTTTEGAGIVVAALGAVGAALIAATAAAVGYATQFESAFAKTQTIMDQSVISASSMRESVLALSTDTAMAASDVSEAVYQAISGSVDTAASIGFVDQANRLAVAGFTELTNATDVLTTTLNAYQMGADKTTGISNVLIQTQNLGKTSVNELSQSMGRAISTGSAYGVNLQNISTGYVELTRGGIATAEATTYLSGMMNELGNEGSKVGTILKDTTGKSFGQLMKDGATLGDVLQILSDSVDGNAEALMGLWSSQEAGKAANAIMVQGISDFNDVCAQMNDELDGTTGTTAAAYGTMTKTAEFMDKQMKNSVSNLAIAYGSKLTPALNAIRSGAAGLLEDMTEYINKNPSVVAEVTGLAAGLVTLAAGYGALMVAKKAKSAVEALNAAVSMNPYAAAAIAVSALAVAIGTTLAISAAAYGENVAAARDYTSAVEEMRGEMEDSIATVEASASMANHYIGELEALEAAGIKTKEQQADYHNTLVLLTQTVPELADSINLETNAIEGGTEALRVQTQEWKENAKAQAMQQYLTDTYAKQAAILVEQEKNSVRLKDATNRRTTAEEYLKKCQEKRNEISMEQNRLAQEYYLQTGTLCDSNNFLTESVAANEAEFEMWQTVLQETTSDITEINGQIDDGSDAAQAAQDEITATELAIGNLTGALNTGTEAINEANGAGAEGTTVFEQWTAASDALAAKYDAVRAAAYESISKQMGLFQNMSGTTKKSVGEMLGALDSQIAYMDTYATNMETAARMGIDEGLLRQLDDGSVESSEILAGMVTMTDDEVTAMNEKFKRVEEGKEDFSDRLATYTVAVSDEGKEMQKAADAAGCNTSSALTEAMRLGLPAFQEQMARYAAAINGVDWGKPARVSGTQQSGTGAGTPYYAGGTESAAAGYAIVGENGPELVYLHGGERILTAEETKNAMRYITPSAPSMRYTGSAAPAIAGAGLPGQTVTIITPVTLDGREIARSTAVYMGEEMSFGVM